MPDVNYQELLFQCRDNFGAAPRSLGLWNRYVYLQVPRPRWCTEGEGLYPFFCGLGDLLKFGDVVWGHVVQANRLMFTPDPRNCPGEMLYCPQTRRAVEPRHLGRIANCLYDLKGTTPRDPQLMPIATYLTDERIRVFGLNVPPIVSPDFPCMVSTVYFKREHLPNRRICSSYMPLIVARQSPRFAMILPERYWPKELIAIWTDA